MFSPYLMPSKFIEAKAFFCKDVDRELCILFSQRLMNVYACSVSDEILN